MVNAWLILYGKQTQVLAMIYDLWMIIATTTSQVTTTVIKTMIMMMVMLLRALIDLFTSDISPVGQFLRTFL